MDISGNGHPTVGAALVVGGGVAGIQAALDLAESGIKVYLVEKSSAIGGRMAELDKTFPTNDCAMCTLAPRLAECGRHPNVELITDAEITRLEGEPGRFRAEVRRRPRFIDLAKCTACGDCAVVCPIKVPNEYNHGLDQRTAAYRLYAQAVPGAYAIDKRGVAPCRDACPAHQRAQGYVALIKERKYKEALRVILEDNPFPGTCGRVCNRSCEVACSRGQADAPVAICALKRFVADRVFGESIETIVKAERTREQRIAIVGAGPAGLTAARDLVNLGYGVTVFESLPVAGGMPRVGIPAYRLPRDVLQQEVDAICALGVDLQLNTALGRDITVAGLRETGYDAVFLAIGAHRSERLRIPGDDSSNVLGAIEFLRKVALGDRTSLDGQIVVIGGGNTAIDAARTALRLGADGVTLAYRRSREEMPADPWEIEAAEAEGVQILYLAAPVAVASDDHIATNLTCQRTRLGEPDASGRRRPEPVPGSEFELPADWIISAISQSVDPSAIPEGLALNRQGTIAVDPQTLATNIPGVFAGGDVVAGGGYVIEAVAAGHRAARAIHKQLSGEELEFYDSEGLPVAQYSLDEVDALLEEGEASARARLVVPERPAAERRYNFDEVEQGLTEDAAVAEAERCLACGLCSECLECVYACQPGAVVHTDRETIREIEIGAVIVATGYTPFDARGAPEFGFGRYPNVLTGPQFERLISASGPTSGHILRPSDGHEPRKVAFLQCVGSRDQQHPYCSSVCCMYATKEAMLALEHVPELQIRIFQMDLRAFGKGFDAYFRRARDQGVQYIRCRVATVKEIAGSRNLIVRHQTDDGRYEDEEFDLVVLSVGMERNAGAETLAETLGVTLNEHGFAQAEVRQPLQSSRPGVFVCGSFKEPKDIPDSIAEASAAAAAAGGLISSARGTLVHPRIYPPEQDTYGQDPRIGVFVCHCGSNIAGVIDVEAIADYARTLPGVVYADHTLYTCSADALISIQQIIAEHQLNRVVVASCTPRTHEPLFQDTIREAGLNPYLFEMANIRDQCSWVHSSQPAEATEKARTLVKMSVARARLLEPLHKQSLGLRHDALVIGGGVAGMSAALALADQGYRVSIVEREKHLGGSAPESVAAPIRERVLASDLIEVLTDMTVSSSAGFVGNFKTTLASTTEPIQRLIEHGVTIVATGGREYRGPQYGLGSDPSVMTQGDLGRMLERSPEQVRVVPSIVIIQCVGPWDQREFYCSRSCCVEAVQNAIHIKQLNPRANVAVLYKEMRTYGFQEELYTEARSRGVIFARYDDENLPKLSTVRGRKMVSVFDPALRERLDLAADLLVLSTATLPSSGVVELSAALKVPITADGFFLEAHPKLRPVDFASEGIYLCGAAHYPKTLEESIIQGMAAAARAATVLAKQSLEVGGVVAQVIASQCAACLTCVRTCPYDVPVIGKSGVAEISVALCQGCGVCAAECPADAIQLLHYLDEQVLAKTAALLTK